MGKRIAFSFAGRRRRKRRPSALDSEHERDERARELFQPELDVDLDREDAIACLRESGALDDRALW